VPERRHLLVLVCGLAVSVGSALATEIALLDPTRPPSAHVSDDTPEASRAGIGSQKVQMILVSPTRRMAVIGGVRVEEGDQIFGADVASILPNEVVLHGPTGEIRLPLRRTVAKARVKSGGVR
jgi:hypothetical protein